MKKAFTLAEVLITLGIIGVVAALTLPSLIQNYREKETVTRVKAAYSILGQAFQRAITEDGTPDNWGMSGAYDETTHEILANKIIPYMKVTDNCIGMDTAQVRKICKPPSGFIFETKTAYAVVRLVNGTVVIFRNYTPTCNWNWSGGKGGVLANVCGAISIDINGNGKPNVYGEDIFAFHVTKNAIIPMGGADDVLESFNTLCNKNSQWNKMVGGFWNGSACAAWVISNENMDYLHCDGLSWAGKHSCKE